VRRGALTVAADDPGSAAGSAGTLESSLARSLSEAFELFQGVRLEHQIRQVERGIDPDDHLDPNDLSRARRRHLRDAFSQVRAVQKKLGGRLSSERAFG
jgi:CBS domain-containing protein